MFFPERLENHQKYLSILHITADIAFYYRFLHISSDL